MKLQPLNNDIGKFVRNFEWFIKLNKIVTILQGSVFSNSLLVFVNFFDQNNGLSLLFTPIQSQLENTLNSVPIPYNFGKNESVYGALSLPMYSNPELHLLQERL